MRPIKVAIVEDDPRFSLSIEQLLSATPERFSFCGGFSDAESALKSLPSLQPDIVLMDIHLPKTSGLECVRQLAPRIPETQIMMLTVSDAEERVFEALRAGATGYLLKRDVFEKLYPAMLELHEGGSPMSASIARKVVQTFQQKAEIPSDEPLTSREIEILDGLASGRIYKEIGDHLGISYNTVRAHVQNIYRKLHVQTRAQAVKKYKGRAPYADKS